MTIAGHSSHVQVFDTAPPPPVKRRGVVRRDAADIGDPGVQARQYALRLTELCNPRPCGTGRDWCVAAAQEGQYVALSSEEHDVKSIAYA